MSETELMPEIESDSADTETQLDRDDRLKPEFVRAVLDAVEEGRAEDARELVEPLHPADIADQLTVGGRLVHRLTHRCVSTCNIVAALAGLGPVEVR